MTRFNIREATDDDLDDVLDVQSRAFGQDEEAHLTRDLLEDASAAPTLSLLGFAEDRQLGHILFTAVTLAGADKQVSASILAPLAVVPEAQGRGLGGELIEQGLLRLSKSGVDLVFVLGPPDYYGRFGFKPAGRLGFEAPYPLAKKYTEGWMVRALRDGVLGSLSGRVKCADALSKPKFWRE